LVKTQFSRGRLEDAWNTLTHLGDPISPLDRATTRIWILLNSRYSSDPEFTGRALEILARWRSDEELISLFIQALILDPNGVRPPARQEDRAAIEEVTQDFLQRFPDSNFLRTVEVGPDEDPLLNMEPFLRKYERRDQIAADFQAQAQAGRLPIGVLGTVSGRSLTEVSLRRFAGRTFSVDRAKESAEMSAIRKAQETQVVVDTTALHTLVILDSGTSESLLGNILTAITTDQLFQDATQARDTLALASEISVSLDPETGKSRISTVPLGEHEIIRERARRITDLMRNMVRVPHPELRELPKPPRQGFLWMTGLDHAIEHGLVYWSDDRVLRSWAREWGVPTFGTFSLLAYLRHKGLMNEAEHAIANADLLRNYHADIEFSSKVYRLAAAGDSWKARAAADALTLTHVWLKPHEVVQYVMEAVSNVVAYPEEVAGWIGAAAIGLARITNDPTAASGNLGVLLKQVAVQPWFGRATFPHIMLGIRSGVREREGLNDPLPETLAHVYAALVKRYDHRFAASLLMNLVSLATEADKNTAARVVLTYGERD
jgi:hypothetical protein